VDTNAGINGYNRLITEMIAMNVIFAAVSQSSGFAAKLASIRYN
jgi:hypothetical protein